MMDDIISEFCCMPQIAIILPAGYGKTELIVNMVSQLDGRQLVLTHTNAGVEVLKQRLKKRCVDSKKYSVQTIAAFSLTWCNSYPQTAELDLSITPENHPQEYYAQLYAGTRKIFSNDWARKVISLSYKGLFVDEYQDCLKEQHEIVLSLTSCFPVRVLGDPLQGIFGWAGELVDWNNLDFTIIEPASHPWRWKNTNPELGEWIKLARHELWQTLFNNPAFRRQFLPLYLCWYEQEKA